MDRKGDPEMSIYIPKMTPMERDRLADIGKKTIKPDERVAREPRDKTVPVRGTPDSTKGA